MGNLYRGTLAYDEPLRMHPKSGTGKRNDPACVRAWKRAWRERNREHFNAYHREDMRKRRRKNPDYGR